MKNLISIITPIYNSEAVIGDTISSLLKQTFSNWELLVVDDCSTDNSFAIVESLAKSDKRIRLYKTIKNSGTAVARNLGISNAIGDFLVFLDSDDLLDPLFLEEQLKYIKETGAPVVTSGYRRLASNSCTDFLPPRNITWKSLLNGNPISCLSTMINLNITGKCYFDESLIKCEDLLYWINMLREFGPAKGNQKILATYRILATSKSRKKVSLIKWNFRVYRKAGCNFFSCLWHVFRWALYGTKKYRNVE